MFEITTLLVLIPALPLTATLVTVALGKPLLGRRSHVPVVTALALAFAVSLALLVQVHRAAGHAGGHGGPLGFERIVPLWTWADVPNAQPEGAKGSLPASAQHGLTSSPCHPAQPEGAKGSLPASAQHGLTSSPCHPAQPEGAQGGTGRFRVEVVLRADPLTAVMLAVVTAVSLLVAVYSIGSMHGDPGYWRFFTYIGLFVFSMTMLVSASNFALLYVFWEAVGLCSYLLIGFWFQKPAAAAAGKKAFLVNRVGDFGFALGIFLIWTTYGTLDFHDTELAGVVTAPGVLGRWALADPAWIVGGGTATAICLLLMLGACGKSAQLPLHVWLPDAMEGPTPVSALIHAATMVTAGVYLVARCAPLFAASVPAQEVVAWIGGTTALMAAVIAVTQTDLKRILAYSTISQLGYMFLAMGAGTLLGVTAGMFHLVTHAFFKGLLFLAAGSVMHAMAGVIDVRRFGGLRHVLPVTHLTFLVGALGLAGVVPLAGFWSKDAILAALWQRGSAGAGAAGYVLLYVLALATALLTALYTFRAFFLTFHGPKRVPVEAGGHAQESPRAMTVPMIVLAVATVVAGMTLEWRGWLEHFLARTPSIAYLESAGGTGSLPAGAEHGLTGSPWHPPVAAGTKWAIAALGTLAAAVGIGLAGYLYLAAPAVLAWLSRKMEALGLYGLSAGKFFVDELYAWLIVRPLEAIARLCAWFDSAAIDGLVNLVGRVPPECGARFRWLQAGLIPLYAMAMLLGLMMMLGALLAW